MSGALLLGIATLICIGVFLNGLRFARVTENPLAGRRLLGMPVQGSNMPVEKMRQMGRVFMAASPLFWLFFAVICFGLVPAQNIQPIQF